MKAGNITDREILEFLLGHGDEASIERLEALAFADDDFSDRVEAVERDLVDSYASGEMVGADRDRFESYYLSSPLRREKVRFARVLASAESLPHARAAPTAAQDTWWSSISGWSPAFGLAAAALVLLLVAVGVWWLETTREPDVAQVTQGAPSDRPSDGVPPEQSDGRSSAPPPAGNEIPASPASSPAEVRPQAPRGPVNRSDTRPGDAAPATAPRIVSLVLPPPLRGAELKSLKLPPGADGISARLSLDSADFPAYRLELRDLTGGRVVWKSGAVRPTRSNGSTHLDVVVPARLLKQQIYQFSVSGVSGKGGAEIIGDYPFKVVR